MDKTNSEAEKNLSDQQQMLQAILDNSPANFVLMGTDYRVLCFNSTIEKTLFSYFGKRITTGDDYRDFVVPDLKTLFLESFEKAKNGLTTIVERETRVGDFSMWFEYRVNPVYTANQELMGVALSAINIDQRKAAENVIIQNNSRMEAILNNTRDSIIFLDLNYKVILFNKVVESHLLERLGKQITAGADFREFIYPGFENEFHSCYDKARKGEAASIEFSIRNNDEQFWIYTAHNPVYDDNNTLFGISIFATDISERKRAEIELQQSEEKFRTIIGAAPNPILVVNRMQKILLANPETETLFGYAPEELIGKDISLLIPYPFDAGKRSKEPGETGGFNHPASARKKDGSEFYIEANLSTLRLGSEEHSLVIIQDITLRLQSEEKLNKFNRELTMLNNINDIILRTESENVLFTEVCNCIVRKGGYKLAWVCYHPDAEDAAQQIKPFAACGETGYLESIQISLANPEMRKGPTATTLLTGKTSVTNNVSLSGTFSPWQESAKRFGIAASIVLAIRSDEHGIIAAMNIYSDQADAFDEHEAAILQRVAYNLSGAVSGIRNKKEKENARYLLRERIKELGTIYRASTILQDERLSFSDSLKQITNVIPPGWQFPEICEAKITFDQESYQTEGYRESPFKQIAEFLTEDGKKGRIEVVYTREKPQQAEGPFFAEERELINALAEMISVHYNKRTAYNSLKKSEANLSSVFGNTDVGHLLLDRNYRIVAFNKSFNAGYAKVTGISLETGRDLTSLLLQDRQESVRKRFETVAQTQTMLEYETEYESEGSRIYYNISIIPVTNDKVTIGFSMSAYDITRRVLLEQEKQQIITDLIQRNKNLEQFSYIVSHNVRAPLANIIGLSNLLTKNPNDKDRSLIINGIGVSAMKLDDVLSDLNQILQARQTGSIEKSIVNLQQMVDDLKLELARHISERSATIACDFSAISEIKAIRPYLQSILHNLVLNAIKYTAPHMRPEISITSERQDKKVAIHVRDNGMGIDTEKYRDKLFGLYKRFHEGTEGKGLGLFMSKTHAESMNGTILVESKPGHGSVFSVIIPE